MPKTGYCTDVTCAQKIIELYECHCCDSLICFKHLLEHVEVSNREKQAQLDVLRNDLISLSFTLEVIVEKKIREIEHEKLLMDQAKTIINNSTCTFEELQSICKEINQAIISNQKEETVVKVESALIDMNSCLYSNEISNETNQSTSEMLNTYPTSSNNIIQQQMYVVDISRKAFAIVPFRSSPSRVLRRRTNEFQKSTTSENVNGFQSNNVKRGTMIYIKDEASSDEAEPMIVSTSAIDHMHCPLTFDGVFGLTAANHSIELCSTNNNFRRNLISHLMQKHNLKKMYARRLYEAIKCGDNPHTTKLFSENEDVIDHDRYVPCPLSNDVINLIGSCPPNSRKIPCLHKSIPYSRIVHHLQQYHNITNAKARTIYHIFKQRHSKMIS